MKPYKWKKPRPVGARNLNRHPGFSDGEVLTGTIQGLEASDHEERFASALTKADVDYTFQPSYIAMRNLPGEIRLDFMVHAGGDYPVQIDGSFTHKTAEQREEDKAKDAILDAALQNDGAQPVQRIRGEDLETQEDADTLVAERFA